MASDDLTKRELFAALAMHAIIGSELLANELAGREKFSDKMSVEEGVAIMANIFANALMKQLDKGE